MSKNQEPVRYMRSSPAARIEDKVETVIKINRKDVVLIATQNGIDIYNDTDNNILYGVKDNRVITKILARKVEGAGYIDFTPLVGIKKDV